MREQVLFYLNGRRHCIDGETVFEPVTGFLRYQQQLTGTKVVCAEGDCGACTVLVGRLNSKGKLTYQPVNGCILYLYQLDCSHVVTIEGLKFDETLNPVQQAMVECHGAQCGYCTPGIVVSLCDMFNRQTNGSPASPRGIQEALTGNLCRCTGYEPIIKAGISVVPDTWISLSQLYPSDKMIADFRAHLSEPVRIVSENRLFYKPATVEQAVQFKQEHPHATLLSGGTDVHVICNKRNVEPPAIISLSHLTELHDINHTGSHLVVGAGVTLMQLEQAVQNIFPELRQMLEYFGSPQIKHAGTLAGNIANGSPIGDTLPFLFVMEAEVELTGSKGVRRVNINQLYTGYKQTAMAPDELISRVWIPLPEPSEILKLYKVSRRKHLDISTFMAAIRMTVVDNRIKSAKLAYGGVGPTVLRLPKTEALLTGRVFTLETFEEAGLFAVQEITPISDVRGSREFRLQLGQNILLKFYYEAQPDREAAPV